MVKCDKVTAPDIICGLNAAAQFCCTIIVRPLSTTKFTGTFPRLTRIGQQGLLRVGVGVLIFVGDALGIVHDELREEDDEDELEEDEEGDVRRAPPMREVKPTHAG